MSQEHKLCLYADEATTAILKSSNSKVFLMGGYLGYQNFGDILQLKGAIKFHLRNSGLTPVVICDLNGANSSDFLDKLRAWYGIQHFVFYTYSPVNPEQLGLQPVGEVQNISSFHLYGGGMLNRYWGETVLNLTSWFLDTFSIHHYVISGQQIDPAFSEILRVHCERYLPCLVGGRDQQSADIVRTLELPGGFSGDDALDILLPWAKRYPRQEFTPQNKSILIHVNTSQYTRATQQNNPFCEILHTLRKRYSDYEFAFLESYSDRRYIVKDTIQTINDLEDAFPFNNYQVIDLAKMALWHDPDATEVDDELSLLNGKFACSSSYHTTLFLNLLGIPCYLFSFNEFYNQKRQALATEETLLDFLENPQIPCYRDIIANREAWLGEMKNIFPHNTATEGPSVSLPIRLGESPFHIKEDGTEHLEQTIAFQESQLSTFSGLLHKREGQISELSNSVSTVTEALKAKDEELSELKVNHAILANRASELETNNAIISAHASELEDRVHRLEDRLINRAIRYLQAHLGPK